MSNLPRVTTIAPWFGSDRMNAERIGAEIGKQDMVSVPFCGGCSIALHIDARQILFNDKHRNLIRLCRTVADEAEFKNMQAILEGTLVHPDYLTAARQVLKTNMQSFRPGGRLPRPDAEWAAAYFTNVWLSRSGTAGTNREFGGLVSSRRTASGGSSVVRWRSAYEGLPQWHDLFKTRCEFRCEDWRDFVKGIRDVDGQAVYSDPPWIKDGEPYIHQFTEADHCDLAGWHYDFDNCRIVVRHKDCPLYRDLYPEPNWTWLEIGGRNQGNAKISECLIINGPSFTAEKE